MAYLLAKRNEEEYSTSSSSDEDEDEDRFVDEPSSSLGHKRGHKELDAQYDDNDDTGRSEDDNEPDGGNTSDEPAAKRSRAFDDDEQRRIGEEIRARSLRDMVARRSHNARNDGSTSRGGGRRPRRSHLDPPSPGRPDPYTMLPPPCDSWIQLRFQLVRFKGVYRIARLPLNYTFATVYKFIMFSFGWSGMHLHEFRVLSNVEMYATRPGEIKKWSQPVPERPDPRDEDAFREWGYRLTGQREPIMRIVPWSPRDVRNEWDNPDFTQVREDYATTLGDVWNRERRQNASKGLCRNQEIAIKFVYDFGGESYGAFPIACSWLMIHEDNWEVHISIDRTKDGQYLFTGEPRDYPEVLVAKGAVSTHVDNAGDDTHARYSRRSKTQAECSLGYVRVHVHITP